MRPVRPGCGWCRSWRPRAPASPFRSTPRLRQERGSRTLTAEWERLGRAFPSHRRSTGPRRGQVALSQDEAWEFMTTTGPTLAAIGFDVRVPTLSRRKATPIAAAVRRVLGHPWSAPTSSATSRGRCCSTTSSSPPPKSRGSPSRRARSCSRAAAGSSSTGSTSSRRPPRSPSASRSPPAHRRRDPAPQHRPRRRRPAGGVVVQRPQLGERHPGAAPPRRRRRRSPRPRGSTASCAPTRPRRWRGSGSSTRAELGGCLALDMGLGKTPTVLAHLARSDGRRDRRSSSRPAAVVGNWAAEAARFAPSCASSSTTARRESSADAARRRRSPAPTSSSPPTPPPSATSRRWRRSSGPRIVLDEAQAIKNPASETAQQLRRIPARTRLALTGTPIENGARRPVGDPRLHQPRPRRTAAGVHRPDVRRSRESARCAR